MPVYPPKGARQIQEDLQKPGRMALEAGTPGSCVQWGIHHPSSCLCVFLKKHWWIFVKHLLNHTISMGKATYLNSRSRNDLFKILKNGTNTSLTEQLELTEEHRSCFFQDTGRSEHCGSRGPKNGPCFQETHFLFFLSHLPLKWQLYLVWWEDETGSVCLLHSQSETA